MSDKLEELLVSEDLTPEQAKALHRALERDPDLRRAWVRWQQLRARARAGLDAALPDRGLLVLHALAREDADLLSEDEAQRLKRARPGLERALEKHPALGAVVDDMQRACKDFDAAWAAHFEPVPVRRAPSRPPRHPSRIRWVARGAIGAAVAAFAVVALLLVQRDTHLVTIRTDTGEMRLVELADGSTVRLLGGSVLSYVDPERETVLDRHARLTGRAFFDVVPSEEAFVIETPTARATVLGTRFGIQADEGMTEVVLARGRLSLAPREAPDRMIVLEPGQMSRVAAHALPSTPAPVDLGAVLDWTGLFIFESTPVRQIVERLRAHFAQPIAVDPSLEDEAVTGTFEQSQPLHEILGVLATALDAEVRTPGTGGFYLAPAREE